LNFEAGTQQRECFAKSASGRCAIHDPSRVRLKESRTMSCLTRNLQMRKVNSVLRERVVEEMNSIKWLHEIDLGNRISTLGRWQFDNPESGKPAASRSFEGRLLVHCCAIWNPDPLDLRDAEKCHG
jgi:hypothetical protein